MKKTKIIKPKLPKRFKDRWVIMLRSGKYNQTNGMLRDDDGYCCLGVACLAAGYKDSNIYDHKTIPLELTKVPKLLMGDNTPTNHNYNPIVSKLVHFNDTKQWTFKQIASYIERYL